MTDARTDSVRPASALGLAQALEADIRRGRWKDGERLPSERALAQQFRLSRATVREGLHLLTGWGRLETRGRVGSVVRRLASPVAASDVIGPQDILEARLAVEPVCARLAASRASPAELQAIEDALGASRGAADVDAFEHADEEFHLAIAQAARSALLTGMQVRITEARQRVGWGYVKQNERPMRARYADQHEAIARALAGRDAVAAEQAAIVHLRTIAQNLLGSH